MSFLNSFVFWRANDKAYFCIWVEVEYIQVSHKGLETESKCLATKTRVKHKFQLRWSREIRLAPAGDSGWRDISKY